MENLDLTDDDVIMHFERAFLITVVLLGVCMIWCFVMGKEGSTPQPRTYVYEGDTVATEDDCREIRRREEGSKATKTKDSTKSRKRAVCPTPAQVPNEICLAQGSDEDQENVSLRDLSRDESIPSVMVAIPEADEGSRLENKDDTVV